MNEKQEIKVGDKVVHYSYTNIPPSKVGMVTEVSTYFANVQIKDGFFKSSEWLPKTDLDIVLINKDR